MKTKPYIFIFFDFINDFLYVQNNTDLIVKHYSVQI